MELAAYISTVTGMVTVFLGAFYFLTGQVGSRIDRLDVKVDRIHDSVAEMGSRITALEHRDKE
ncbi:MAG: hypothetical protein ACRDV1_06475 [Actinomycetes bacterium]